MTAPGKKKSGDVDDVIMVPVPALNDIGAFGNFCTAWLFRGAEIAEGRNFKAPVTATATDANGKRCFVFKFSAGNKFSANDIAELDLEAVAMPIVMVIEDSEGKVARMRMQMESETLQ